MTLQKNLSDLLDDTGITIQDIIDDYLVLIRFDESTQTNDETTIEEKLVRNVCGSIKTGSTGRWPCYLDKEDNIIRNGIPFRDET